MYVSSEEQWCIAEKLATYFVQGEMVFFAKQSAQLYEEYGEFTADDIMRKTKRKILEASDQTKSIVQMLEKEMANQKYIEGYQDAMKKTQSDIQSIYQETSPTGAKLAKIRGYLKIEPQDV